MAEGKAREACCRADGVLAVKHPWGRQACHLNSSPLFRRCLMLMLMHALSPMVQIAFLSFALFRFSCCVFFLLELGRKPGIE